MAQRVCPDRKSLPDRKRSAKVSTVGRRAPKTRICPSKNASVAFIVQLFVSFTFSTTKWKVLASCFFERAWGKSCWATGANRLIAHALSSRTCTGIPKKIVENVYVPFEIKNTYQSLFCNQFYIYAFFSVMVATLGCYLENAHAYNWFRNNHPFPSCSRLNRLLIKFIRSAIIYFLIFTSDGITLFQN